jgi:hypothetical protein
VTTDRRPFEEINIIAKLIKEQALVVTDGYLKLLKKAISSNPSKGSEVGAVLRSNAEKNVDLVQEFVHKLSDARDFQDAFRAHVPKASSLVIRPSGQLSLVVARGRKRSYSPIVRMTLLSGRVLLEDSLSSCASISSYFGTVATSPFGTMCTTL